MCIKETEVMARKKIIAGNWKMNMTPSEAVALVNELKPLVVNDEVDVVFCVPAIDIIPAMEAAKGTNIQIGAENMYFEESGDILFEIIKNEGDFDFDDIGAELEIKSLKSEKKELIKSLKLWYVINMTEEGKKIREELLKEGKIEA